MKLLDLTLPTPAENLALDEALLDDAEQGGGPAESLRVWESPQPFVVLGRSSRAVGEVDLEECCRRGLPLLRRCSGGASVVVGPGCLMYAVVLSYELRPHLQSITEAHRLVMATISGALQKWLPAVAYQGTSDLTRDGRKFSGNSLRCKRTHLLYHGTLLYDFPLELISACLKTPPREPGYRQGRAHHDFVANLPIDGDCLRSALAGAWRTEGPMTDWPAATAQSLAASRYRDEAWNLRL